MAIQILRRLPYRTRVLLLISGLCLGQIILIIDVTHFYSGSVPPKNKEDSLYFHKNFYREQLRQISYSSTNSKLGVIVYLANQMNATIEGCNDTLARKKLLLHSILTVQKYWFSAMGYGYKIIIFHEDWPIAEQQYLLHYANKSAIEFAYIGNLQIPPDHLTFAQVENWTRGHEGGVGGKSVGYRMMCRAWCGPIQNHPALDGFYYYLRLDDDSFFKSPLPFDPFLEMEKRKCVYAYRAKMNDTWGICGGICGGPSSIFSIV